jgi:hypothetical protein
MARKVDALPVETEALVVQGLLRIEQGDTARAAAALAGAERAADRLHDRRLLLMARLYGAAAARSTPRLTALIREIEEIRLTPLAGRARLALARQLMEAGHPGAARESARAAIEAATRIGQQDLMIQAQDLVAAAARRSGDRQAAAEACAAVARLLQEVGSGLDESLAAALKRRPRAGCAAGN